MAGFESEIPPEQKPGTPQQSPAIAKSLRFPKNNTFQEISGASTAEAGSEILAKAWQQISDPAFAELLGLATDLTSDELDRVVRSARAIIGRRQGRAQA